MSRPLSGVLGTVENHHGCFSHSQCILAFLTLTDTYAHTHREKKETCQRSPFILHVSRNDKELPDRGASERGERVTGSEHSLVWKWLQKTRTIRSNPTMLSMFRGTNWPNGPGTMLVSVKFRQVIGHSFSF